MCMYRELANKMRLVGDDIVQGDNNGRAFQGGKERVNEPQKEARKHEKRKIEAWRDSGARVVRK